eukprot:scaffold4744_cov49-Cyclotella_meneghiniana.AAC.3
MEKRETREDRPYLRAAISQPCRTSKPLSADEVIGEINDANYSFVPIAIGPHGKIGSIFKCIRDGTDPLPLPSFSKDQPEAKQASERSISIHTPWNILGKADDARWRSERRERIGPI